MYNHTCVHCTNPSVSTICVCFCTLVDGDLYTVYTPNEDRAYNTWIAPKQESFLFEVEACSDVHLMLSPTPGFVDATNYEVVIGGWTNTRYE